VAKPDHELLKGSEMNEELTRAVKETALRSGVVKVGVAGIENLAGPPEADLKPLLPGAAAVVSFLVVEPEDAIMKYLSKKDPEPYRDHFYENLQLVGRAGLAVAETLRSRGYQALPLSPNGVYTEGSNVIQGLKPPFSHRYAAVAAGLGAIGLSGNVVTPEYGARVCLGSVICDAPLVPDLPLDENPCDRCRTCLRSCPVGFMSAADTVTFIMGGREITHAKTGLHARCSISCAGFAGLSRDGKWSTWAPADHPVSEDDGEMLRLLGQLATEYFRKHSESPELPNFFRLSQPMPGYPEDAQGILARGRFDTYTTCGNCAIVCSEDRQKRADALKALRKSGFVLEDDAGNIRVVRSL
jgi:epoxyqueuosine reductase